MNLPPNVSEHDRVILFDGVCKLCNAWSNFIIKYDKQRLFTLCSVQSLEGQKILRHYNLPTDTFETMLYVEKGSAYQKSDAFLKVMSAIGMPWRLICVVKIVPQRLRNWLYDRIALNRYSLFGKFDYCTLPSPDHDLRYLNGK